jgi:L-amino acid N-acyltransferase YncA
MKLRIASIKDADQIVEIYAPYVLNTNISFETVVPTVEEMQKRIESVLTANPWIVLEEDGLILGYAYATKHRERAGYRWSVDSSIYVRQGLRGKGIGKALYSALLPILKLQGYYNVYAGICLPNEASVGIHESFGFMKIGHYSKVGYKSGQWLDTGWWGLSLREPAAEPAEPIPLSALSDEAIAEIFSKVLGGE